MALKGDGPFSYLEGDGSEAVKFQIVTRYFFPVKAGVETHCYEVARRVKAMGHDVTIFTRDDGFEKEGPLPAEEKMDGFSVIRSPSNRRLSKQLDMKKPIYLNNFDISLTFFLYMRAFFSRLRGARLTIWLVPHGGYTPYWELFPLPRRLIKRMYHRTLGRYFINHLTCGVSALNNWEKDQLIKAGINDKLITIRTNGVEDLAYDLPTQNLGDHELAWLNGQRYVLMLCRVSREKNIDGVVEAISALQELHLVIGGSIQDKAYYDELKAIISEKGLDGRVHFVGYVSGGKKYALIDGAKAVALTSLYECDPIVVKEALVRGRSIIASAVGPLPSIVAEGENGFLVDPEDVQSIFSALSRVLTLTAEERKNMEGKNRKKAIQYRWGEVTSGLIEDIEHCEGMRNG